MGGLLPFDKLRVKLLNCYAVDRRLTHDPP